MNNAVLCVDIGTSSLKAAYISFKGEVFAFARIEFKKANESNRWLFALKEAVSSLNKSFLEKEIKTDEAKNLENQKKLPKIKAISISGNGPSLANSFGSLIWNESIESVDLSKMPKEAAGSIFAPRLFYIKEKMDFMLNQGEYLFSVPEYLVYQLTDKAYTLLPNERYIKAYWSEDLLKSIDYHSEAIPPFLELGKASGTLSEKAQKILEIDNIQLIDDEKIGSQGQVEYPPVFCGGPDFSIALIGTNTLSEGKICDRAGTSEGINLCTNQPIFSSLIRTLPSPINPFWNASVIIPDTGSRFSNWKANSIYKDLSYEECVNTLISEKNSEGYKLMIDIALKVKEAYNQLKSVAEEKDIQLDDKICCTGGQAKNQSWLKLKSEIVEVPFYVQKCADSELVGNACVASYGIGIFSSMEKAAEELTKN